MTVLRLGQPIERAVGPFIDGCSVAGLGPEWAWPVGMEEAHHHIRMKPTTRSTAERRSVLWSIMNHCLLPDLGAR